VEPSANRSALPLSVVHDILGPTFYVVPSIPEPDAGQSGVRGAILVSMHSPDRAPPSAKFFFHF